MKFYHGSQNGNLKELNLQHYSGKIYLTDDEYVAFFYAGSSLRFGGYSKDGKVVFQEKCSNCFKMQFAGHGCFIYQCEVENFEVINHHFANHVYVSQEKAELKLIETVDDCYAKLLELAENGEIVLEFWEDYTKEQQKKITENFISTFGPHMQYEKNRFPEEYELLIRICPQLKVDENEKEQK